MDPGFAIDPELLAGFRISRKASATKSDLKCAESANFDALSFVKCVRHCLKNQGERYRDVSCAEPLKAFLHSGGQLATKHAVTVELIIDWSGTYFESFA